MSSKNYIITKCNKYYYKFDKRICIYQKKFAIVVIIPIPTKLNKTPYRAISFILTTPLDIAIAFGGVAIGNINA